MSQPTLTDDSLRVKRHVLYSLRALQTSREEFWGRGGSFLQVDWPCIPTSHNSSFGRWRETCNCQCDGTTFSTVGSVIKQSCSKAVLSCCQWYRASWSSLVALQDVPLSSVGIKRSWSLLIYGLKAKWAVFVDACVRVWWPAFNGVITSQMARGRSGAGGVMEEHCRSLIAEGGRADRGRGLCAWGVAGRACLNLTRALLRITGLTMMWFVAHKESIKSGFIRCSQVSSIWFIIASSMWESFVFFHCRPSGKMIHSRMDRCGSQPA